MQRIPDRNPLHFVFSNDPIHNPSIQIAQHVDMNAVVGWVGSGSYHHSSINQELLIPLCLAQGSDRVDQTVGVKYRFAP